MDCVISEICYKETILHFMVISYNSFVKFHGKKNEVCYIGTTLYMFFLLYFLSKV